MKTYLVLMTTSHTRIEAHTITFEPGHVCFWSKPNVLSGGVPRLIRAIHNPAVEEIREVES